MKTLLSISLFIAAVASAKAQTFDARSFISLADTLSFHDVAWMDTDNDGFADVAAFAVDASGNEVVLLLKGSASGSLQYVRSIDTGIADAAHFIMDEDGDNMLDIVVSGQVGSVGETYAFLNRGDAGFDRVHLFSSGAHAIAFADLDQDGSAELLLSGRNGGGAFLRILKRKPAGWTIAHDSIAFDATAITTFDFDDDNDVDIFVSGTEAGGAPTTRAYLNQKQLHFTSLDFPAGISGKTTVSDLNGDGNLDILLAGTGPQGDRLLRFLNTGSGFSVTDTLSALKDAGIFAADLNSDGLCDISIAGTNAAGDTLNVVFSASGASPVLHTHLVTQAFGDYEHDGDLDIVQLVNAQDGYGLRVVENVTGAINKAPDPPAPINAKIFNRTFSYWDKCLDDHTDERSLTYDVAIASAATMMSPMFDVLSGYRLAPASGNNGTANYLLLRQEIDPGAVSIQAVDNSLYGSVRSVCNAGSGSGGSGCLAMDTTTVPACAHERVVLAGGEGALWFSFRDGFLGAYANYAFDFTHADTIFTLVRGTPCARIAIYVVGKGQKITKKTDTTRYVCEGAAIRLGVEKGWENVEWSSAAKGFLSQADSIDFVAVAPDTIRVMVSDSAQCVILRSFDIVISKPEVSLANDTYQVIRGQSVRLSVSGGVSWQWMPPATLDDAGSSSPLATPLKTTEYIVTVTDSIGCQASAHVVVLVEETAFIPNLFTPNRDGNNDELRVYGLTEANRFSLRIFNREGKKVYQATTVSEITNQGWDGTSGGVDQPAGVYFWKLDGESPTGRKLLLNGKNSGSIVLVR